LQTLVGHSSSSFVDALKNYPFFAMQLLANAAMSTGCFRAAAAAVAAATEAARAELIRTLSLILSPFSLGF